MFRDWTKLLHVLLNLGQAHLHYALNAGTDFVVASWRSCQLVFRLKGATASFLTYNANHKADLPCEKSWGAFI